LIEKSEYACQNYGDFIDVGEQEDDATGSNSDSDFEDSKSK
jgi:hypothetical protein